jgi:transposase InsO family protein
VEEYLEDEGIKHEFSAPYTPQQNGVVERKNMTESAFIPFVSFGDLDNNTFKGLTSLLSVEQEIQYDEHT